MKINEATEKALFVPMHVGAVIVGKDEKLRYADLNLRYQTLRKSPSGQELESNPFSQISTGKKGVHLHWLLPDALTHGIQEEEGDAIVYPCVPNRWLVTRLALSENVARKPVVSRISWIVESDFLSKDRSNPAYSSTISDPSDGVMPYYYIGTSRIYRDGTEITSFGPHLERLTAVASGVPYFAAYYPQCRNVFGFYDALGDINTADGSVISLDYMVAGWYEDAPGDEKDPLRALQSAEEIEARLRWKYGANKEVPRHTVCHGMVGGLYWRGLAATYPSGVPYETDMPAIAAGNSSEEALAALVGYLAGKPEMEPVLHSLLTGGLAGWDALDGELQAQKQMHETRFRAEKPKEALRIQGENAKLLWQREDLLRELSALRQKEELEEECLQVRRQEIYTAWEGWLGDRSAPQKQAIFKLCEEALLHREHLEDIAREITALKDELTRSLHEGETLLDTGGQRYWQPTQPVVLMEGAAQSSIYKKLENYLEDGFLACRTEDEVVKGVSVCIPAITENETRLIQARDYMPTGGYLLPYCMEALAEEAFLMSESGRRFIAYSLAMQAQGNAPQNLLDHIVSEYKKHMDLPASVVGKLPNLTAVYKWTPSFYPLILEWSVLFYPDPKLFEKQYELDHWTLEEQDYAYTGPPLLQSKYSVFRGRTILSPHASENMEKRLDEYMPDGFEWLKLKVKNMRMLSQCLSGLNERFLGKSKEVQVPIWQAGGEDQSFIEKIQSIVGDAEVYRAKDDSFFPVRAGLMVIEDLSAIDRFGRKTRYEIKDVVLPASFRTNQAVLAKHVLLRPRILAPLRLEAVWDSVIIEQASPEESPVYGFVWANLIDSMLHIYTAAGRLAGSLQIIYDMNQTGTYRVSFRNPPGETRSEDMLFLELEPELRRFVEGLYRASLQNPVTLYEFLHVIDEQMWNIHTGRMQANSEIFAYMGHPVALAGLSFCLDIRGDYPEPLSSAAKETANCSIRNMHIPVRIGDRERQKDGTIGFYVLDGRQDYDRFHAAGITGKLKSGYIDTESVLRPQLSKARETVKLTVLLSPYAAVNLTTGLLPVKEMKLPEAVVEKALERIYLTIFCGPFLTPRDELRFFLPKAMEKEWSFMSYRRPGEKQESREIKLPWLETTDFETLQVIKEGWIKLNADKGKRREKKDE